MGTRLSNWHHVIMPKGEELGKFGEGVCGVGQTIDDDCVLGGFFEVGDSPVVMSSHVVN